METAKRTLYEGKTKIVFANIYEKFVIQHFKDNISAFNAQKTSVLAGKGALNNRISFLLMQHLEKNGVKTHIVELLNDKEQLVKKAVMFNAEVVVRNFASGSFCKKYNIARGSTISPPVVEFYYKDDALSDPLMADDHIVSLGIATKDELLFLKETALKINEVLEHLFKHVNITLVDFKLEFGRLPSKEIILADEISPDTCRLLDATTGQVLDKDLYRLDIGCPLTGYSEVLRRIEAYSNL